MCAELPHRNVRVSTVVCVTFYNFIGSSDQTGFQPGEKFLCGDTIFFGEPPLNCTDECIGIKIYIEVERGIVLKGVGQIVGKNNDNNITKVIGKGILPLHMKCFAIKMAVRCV